MEKDAILTNDISHGHRKGQRERWCWGRPETASSTACYQRQCTFVYTSHFARSFHILSLMSFMTQPCESGLCGWEEGGCVLCLRSHSQLTLCPLLLPGPWWPPETTWGSPGSPSSRNRNPSPYLISPPTRPVLTCFTVSFVICMPPQPLVQKTQQQCIAAWQQPHTPT